MGPRQYLVGLFVVLALIVAACGDDGETSGDDTDATDPPSTEPETTDPPGTDPPGTDPPATDPPTTDPVFADSFRGVTATEIHVGIGYNDATEFGVDNGDKQAKWQSAIDAVNDNGGVLGRMLVPYYEEYPSTGSIEQTAACVRHTEDIGVFAFIGEARQDNELCYTRDHDTIAINSFESTEANFEQSNGLLWSAQPSLLDIELQAVEAAAEAGLIDGVNLFVYARAEVADSIPPVRAAIEAAGGNVLGELVPSAPQGDLPAIRAEADAQLERVRVEGGETVFAVSDGGLSTAGAAKRTGSEILTITTFANGSIYVALGYTPEDINLEVFSPVPLESRYENDQAGIRECVERFEADSGETVNIGVPDPTPDNFGTTVSACKAIDLFVTIAEAAGADLTNESFQQAAAGLGEFDLVGALGASLGPDKFSADDSPLVRLEWDSALEDFVVP